MQYAMWNFAWMGTRLFSKVKSIIDTANGSEKLTPVVLMYTRSLKKLIKRRAKRGHAAFKLVPVRPSAFETLG